MRNIGGSLWRTKAKFLMVLLHPLRELGVFGTPDNPVTLSKGADCPFYLFMKTSYTYLRFLTDSECFYDEETRQMVVRPLFEEVEFLFEAGNIAKGDKRTNYIVGAPTLTYLSPRNKPPRKKKKIKLPKFDLNPFPRPIPQM